MAAVGKGGFPGPRGVTFPVVDVLGGGWAVAVSVLGAATVAGLFWRRRQGRLTPVAPGSGGAVSLLLFTTPTCSSCARVREICATIDAPFQEVDASAEIDRARAFDVWRAPTLFVLDREGAPLWRATGVPARADLVAAVNP